MGPAADRTWNNEYDPAGLAVHSTEPGGIDINRTFDELGRLTNELGTGPGAAAASRGYTYDPAGYLTSATSPVGSIGLLHDDSGLLTQTTGPTQYQSSYAYDPSGRMLTRNDAAGTSTITWTPNNQPATVSDPLTASTETSSHRPARLFSQAACGAWVRNRCR